MTLTTLPALLQNLELQITLSTVNIASQLAMIERDRADGVYPGTSTATLAILRVVLAAQEANCARLRAERNSHPLI